MSAFLVEFNLTLGATQKGEQCPADSGTISAAENGKRTGTQLTTRLEQHSVHAGFPLLHGSPGMAALLFMGGTHLLRKPVVLYILE